VNAHKRLHGFNLGLNCTASAKFSADRGRDRTMNRPNPRRGRRAAGRIGRTPPPAPPGPTRLSEAPRMTPDPDVRQELVARIRQEIRAGTYDTPEKFEAALDRLATCLDLG
jgi:Anti-sigma-28 factor, FlgM